MNLLQISLRNILRNSRRTLLTLMSILVGVGGLVLFNGFIEYSLWGLRESTIQSGLGHLQVASDRKYFVSGTYDPFTFLLEDQARMEGVLERLPGVRKVIPQVKFSANLSMEGRTGVAIVTANDPAKASELYGFRSILQGRELEPGDSQRILLGRGLAEKLGAEVGSTVTLLAATSGGGVDAQDFEVVGTCTLGSQDLENVAAFTTLSSAYALLSIERSPLLVVLLDETELSDAVAARAAIDLGGLGAPFVVQTWESLADYYRQARDLYANMLAVVQWIILLIVVFAIANTMTMAIMERTREIGTLRAMGTPDHRVWSMLVVEAVLLGFAGGLLGILVGYLVAWTVNLLGGIYIPPPPGRSDGYYALFEPSLAYAARIGLLATIVAAVAAVYPSLRAIRLRIADCLRSL